jgi:hypothetical protein
MVQESICSFDMRRASNHGLGVICPFESRREMTKRAGILSAVMSLIGGPFQESESVVDQLSFIPPWREWRVFMSNLEFFRDGVANLDLFFVHARPFELISSSSASLDCFQHVMMIA